MLEKKVGSRLRWRGQCFGGLVGSLIVVITIIWVVNVQPMICKI